MRPRPASYAFHARPARQSVAVRVSQRSGVAAGSGDPQLDLLESDLPLSTVSYYINKDAELQVMDSEMQLVLGKLAARSAQLLHSRGLMSMRGLLEYYQADEMFLCSVMWDPQDPVTCWAKYVRANTMLQRCIKDKGLPEDPQVIAEIIVETYQALVQNPLSEINWPGAKLVIGKPLVREQRRVMACLCEVMGLAYEIART